MPLSLLLIDGKGREHLLTKKRRSPSSKTSHALSGALGDKVLYHGALVSNFRKSFLPNQNQGGLCMISFVALATEYSEAIRLICTYKRNWHKKTPRSIGTFFDECQLFELNGSTSSNELCLDFLSFSLLDILFNVSTFVGKGFRLSETETSNFADNLDNLDFLST